MSEAKIDVIILSLIQDELSLLTTKNCVDSFLKTGNNLINKIFVVETNPNIIVDYNSSKVKVIQPNLPFNYNKFFNFALKLCTADYIVSSNSDVVLEQDSLQKLIQLFDITPGLQSVCPDLNPPMPLCCFTDSNWESGIHEKKSLKKNALNLGYEMLIHMHGCFYMCKRNVFEQIGFLDERFYFYYQDNDYIKSLERLNIQHGIYTGTFINHMLGNSLRLASEKYQPTQKNMLKQKEILLKKWNLEEPFCSGGYKPFKPYSLV